MGLFRELGRRAERFTRQVEAAAEATRACPDCGEPVAVADDECPACGSEDLESPD